MGGTIGEINLTPLRGKWGYTIKEANSVWYAWDKVTHTFYTRVAWLHGLLETVHYGIHMLQVDRPSG